MKARRRLRRLSVDEALIRRRAAGETLRDLARDYDVAHTTLGRYFTRPESQKKLKDAQRQLRTEKRRRSARRLVERRLERQVRRRAKEQAALERERKRRYRAERARWNADWPSGGAEAIWMHRRYEPQLQLSSDLHSTYDEDALQVAAAGGGTQALLAATELPTLESAARQIDAVVLAQVLDNDALERAQHQPVTLRRPRLRRLVPDSELLRRRATGEPLRTLAPDYAVAHTTLARFFSRREIKHQLRETAEQLRDERRVRTAARYSAKPRRNRGHVAMP